MSQHGGRFRLAAAGAVAHAVVGAALLSALPRIAVPAGESQADAWPGRPGPGAVRVSNPGDQSADPALVPGARSVDPANWFHPAGRNQGTEGLASALATVALAGNEPLYVSDGWGRTGPGVHSDHHVLNTNSWAFDLAVRGVEHPTSNTDIAARRIAAALGHRDWGGGDLRATVGGCRFQLLWRVPGHFNHVHVGVRGGADVVTVARAGAG